MTIRKWFGSDARHDNATYSRCRCGCVYASQTSGWTSRDGYSEYEVVAHCCPACSSAAGGIEAAYADSGEA